MNERTRQLKEKAIALLPYSEYVSDAFVEQFTKLIAEECSNIAMVGTSNSPEEYEDLDDYDKGGDDSSYWIAGQIRRLFDIDQKQKLSDKVSYALGSAIRDNPTVVITVADNQCVVESSRNDYKITPKD